MNIILLKKSLDENIHKNILVELRESDRERKERISQTKADMMKKSQTTKQGTLSPKKQAERESPRGRIVGSKWMSDTSEERIEIESRDLLHRSCFNMKSDLAESVYAIYVDGNGEQTALKVETTLVEKLRKERKSPWQRSVHVIESITQSNQAIRQFIEDGRIMGCRIKHIVNLFRFMTDQISFDQKDRSRTLKQQLRTVLNMIPSDFNELIIDEDGIDIFCPQEQLDGQCLCDYNLDNLEWIKKKLEPAEAERQRIRRSEKGSNNTTQHNSLIDIFCSDLEEGSTLKEDLKAEDYGYIRDKGEVINGFYGANSLQRCFFGARRNYESAKTLLSHIFSDNITFEERNVIMAAMPFILECPVEPYPFDFFGKFFEHQANDTLCFYQNLKKHQDKTID